MKPTTRTHCPTLARQGSFICPVAQTQLDNTLDYPIMDHWGGGVKVVSVRYPNNPTLHSPADTPQSNSLSTVSPRSPPPTAQEVPITYLPSAREKEIETGDGQMSRTRKRGGGPVEVIQREYQNIPECHVWDDSGFSPPNVGRFAVVLYTLK